MISTTMLSAARKQASALRRTHIVSRRRHNGARRRGAAALDYVLVLGVILPLATFMLSPPRV